MGVRAMDDTQLSLQPEPELSKRCSCTVAMYTSISHYHPDEDPDP